MSAKNESVPLPKVAENMVNMALFTLKSKTYFQFECDKGDKGCLEPEVDQGKNGIQGTVLKDKLLNVLHLKYKILINMTSGRQFRSLICTWGALPCEGYNNKIEVSSIKKLGMVGGRGCEVGRKGVHASDSEPS